MVRCENHLDLNCRQKRRIPFTPTARVHNSPIPKASTNHVGHWRRADAARGACQAVRRSRCGRTSPPDPPLATFAPPFTLHAPESLRLPQRLCAQALSTRQQGPQQRGGKRRQSRRLPDEMLTSTGGVDEAIALEHNVVNPQMCARQSQTNLSPLFAARRLLLSK